ncbi:unnamed protein product [Mesocestoides corti]|uniref:B box-type domain-containing protein n=1 Tax=Mesocestoides corti TaxID=53468 RepID=A0A3P6GKY6_MESCO|nr:unnamed protein product [Mesocestoides corti]
MLTNVVLCKLTHENETPNCSWCAEGGETNISIGHCEQCGQWLCSECIKGHNRMPPLRSHTVKIVGDSGGKGLQCEAHPRESLELFCETCGVLTCRDCQLSVHRDHGGHRWVKEKADLLRPGLLAAMHSLEERAAQLQAMAKAVKEAPAILKTSVEDAKAAQRRSTEAVVRAINEHNKRLEEDLDEKAGQHVQRLEKTYAILQCLQDQINYILQLTRRLFENGEKDPASLVQLAACLERRLAALAKEATDLAADDNAQANINVTESARGWRDSVASRVVFLPNRSPEEVAHLISSVCWTHDRNDGKGELTEFNERKISVDMSDKSTNSDSGEGGDLLDLMTHLDSPPRDGDGGCAVCHSPGVLAVCAGCQRCFHPACHLPRFDPNNVKSPEAWTCSLCLESSKPETSQTRRVRDAQTMGTVMQPCKWTRDQFKSGCRILLSLLCHPEAVFFTSSNLCPICCSSLESSHSGVSGDAEGLCGVFHRFSDLRECLESSETATGKSIEAWIQDIDAFIENTSIQSKELGALAVTQTLEKAACSLRDALDASVESFYPAFFQA